MEDTARAIVPALAALMLIIAWLRHTTTATTAIPTIGSTGLISSYRSAIHFLLHTRDVIQEGYEKYPNQVFRVPNLIRWEYIVNGAKLGTEALQSDYTMGPEVSTNPYHSETVRTNLTRNLGRCFPDVRDEIVNAFDDIFALDGEEWKELHVLPSLMQVVARTSNRLFVGLPLCRNQKYLDLAIDYTIAIFARGTIISLLPNILKPILGPIISTRKSTCRRALRYLGPMLNERLAKEAELGGDWEGKPNDFVSWLLEKAEGSERTPPALAVRIMATNMAAIHTSSMALTHALYDLTTYPEHILPMREEAERVTREEGWTKPALNSMHKIDSFLRESQRMNGNGSVIMTRKVVSRKGFTFSDGTTLPYGAFVSLTALPVHLDDVNYADANAFDGFRFSKERDALTESPEEKAFRQHMITTGMQHLVFGHGKHACPGRFFAATELKAMLAHIVINYDVKSATDGVRPPDNGFGFIAMPNRNGKIWIRKRQ
ncbi:cytochrome P450 [Mycena rebaudengoi]|nr:cytochrome P450 [Mycena rebaudengoi]